MERRNLALLCAGVLCFWLFALAFGTAEGRGVAVQAELPTAAPAAVEDHHRIPIHISIYPSAIRISKPDCLRQNIPPFHSLPHNLAIITIYK